MGRMIAIIVNFCSKCQMIHKVQGWNLISISKRAFPNLMLTFLKDRRQIKAISSNQAKTSPLALKKKNVFFNQKTRNNFKPKIIESRRRKKEFLYYKLRIVKLLNKPAESIFWMIQTFSTRTTFEFAKYQKRSSTAEAGRIREIQGQDGKLKIRIKGINFLLIKLKLYKVLIILLKTPKNLKRSRSMYQIRIEKNNIKENNKVNNLNYQ